MARIVDATKDDIERLGTVSVLAIARVLKEAANPPIVLSAVKLLNVPVVPYKIPVFVCKELTPIAWRTGTVTNPIAEGAKDIELAVRDEVPNESA